MSKIIYVLVFMLAWSWASAQTWEAVGPNEFNQPSYNDTDNSSIAIDANGTPYVAYREWINSVLKASVRKFNGTTWETVGNPGFSPGGVDYISIAISSTGIPYVAFWDTYNNGKATVMKFNGTTWETVGIAGFSTAGAFNISLALNSSDIPYVAFGGDFANNGQATVMKYNGTTWETVGGGSFSAGNVAYTSIAISTGGTPYVAYRDAENGFKVTVMKFNGNSWEPVGNAGISASVASYISLAINSGDVPYVAYSDGGNESRVTVMKFNGTTWETVGNSGFSSSSALYIDLALDDNSMPYVTYSGNGYKAITMKFDGSNWIILGGSRFSAGAASYTSIAINSSGTPYVTYVDNQLHNKAVVKKFIGNNWETVGETSFSVGTARYTSMNLDGNGTPYVAYCDHVNKNRATVMKFNGINWEAVGLPFSSGPAVLTALAIDKNGIPYVAYGDSASLWKAVVKKFNGSYWELVGNPGFSIGQFDNPSLAIDNNSIPYLAYLDYALNNKATVMKFNGTNWENVGSAGFSAGQVHYTSLALNSNGIPYVAYTDLANGQKATVMKFNGSDWEPVGNVGFSPGYGQHTSIAFNSTNIPYVVFQDGLKANVMRFNGTNWETVGNTGFSAGFVQYTNIAFNSTGIPYVAYCDGFNGLKGTVMKLNGNNWEALGIEGFSPGIVDNICLAINSSGTIYTVVNYGGAWAYKFQDNCLNCNPPTVSSISPTSGSVGTLVTVTGTNLSNPTSFTIGGVPAIVVSNDGTTLVGMVMPGATTGNVSITTANGTATSGGSFTVTPTLYPTAQQGDKLVGTGAVQTYTNILIGSSVSVSADGNTAIVGGIGDNGGIGAAWVFTRNGEVWTQQGSKLVGTDIIGYAQFGISVSLSADGNTAIIGGSNGYDGGAAWIFTRSGGVWTQQGSKLSLTNFGGSPQFGKSVSLSADGNTAIVGGFFDNDGVGAAWIYTRSSGVWTQQGNKLVGTGSIGASWQGCSVSLSADGNTAIVGGLGDNINIGATWVFTRNNGVWTQQGNKLVGTEAIDYSYQGCSVSLSADGNTAIVGGYGDNNYIGATWVFTRNNGVWTQQGNKLVGLDVDGNAWQGMSVSLSADGNTAIVGGGLDNNIGAAWVYTCNGGVWSQQESKIIGTGAAGSANQGSSVSISADANTAIVGGPHDGVIGSAWVYINAPCINPTNGGIISNAQRSCGGSEPPYITSASLPTGQSGILEYKWQVSTVSSSSGFADIEDSNYPEFYPSELIGQPTWYKRLARVGCMADWTGAIESNILLWTPPPTIAPNASVTAQPTSSVPTGTITITSPVPADDIYYSIDGITYSNTTGVFQDVAPGPYNVTFKNASGCVSPATRLTVNPIPAIPVITSFTPDAGPVGTLVTITGTGLSNPNSFIIGGIQAIIVSNDGTTLVGMVMPGAITGVVSITTEYGMAESESNFKLAPTLYPSVQQGDKLIGTDNIGQSQQGFSVSISANGNTAIVGGPSDNPIIVQGGYQGSLGAAWIYTRNGGIWTQQGNKLVGTGAVGYARQGASVSISADGNTAIVGGPADNFNVGASWIFIRNGDEWTQQGSKLVGTFTSCCLSGQGSSVSISADGNTVIVGGSSPSFIGDVGAAWIFTRFAGVWTQQGSNLLGSEGYGNEFHTTDYAVAISADGETAIMGANNDNLRIGSAWIFTRNGDVWTQQGNKLVGTDAVGQSQQGISVALSADGNTAIVGGNEDNGKGAAWIYIRSGSIWSQQGSKLVATGAVGNAYQGRSVSLSADGNTAMVGGPYDNSTIGASWVYTRIGDVWTQQGSKLVGAGGGVGSTQGWSLSLSADGNTAIVGGFQDNISIGASWMFNSPCVNPTTAGIIGNEQSGCGSFPPSTITSTELPNGHTGILEYKWQVSIISSSSGFADIISSNSETYSPGAVYQTSWFRRLARVNCMNDWTGAAQSNVIEITVNPAPAAPTASVTTQPTCSVATGTITVSDPSPASGITYSIDGSDYTNTTGVFTAVASGTYNVTVKVGDCTSDPTSVTVNPQPGIPTIAIGSTTNPLTCGGLGSIVLNFTNVQNGTYTISYTSGSFTNVTVANNTATVSAMAGTYNNLQITVNGCTSATGVNATLSDPSVSYGTLASGDQSFCGSGDPSLISFSSMPTGSSSFGYQWYFRNGLNSSPTGTDATGWTLIAGATSSSYDPPSGLTQSRTYAVMVSSGCASSAATWAGGSRQITVENPPAVTITASSPDNFNTDFTLTANALPAGSYTYLWSPGGATTQSITLNGNNADGLYTVVVTTLNGCSSAPVSYNYQKQNLVNSYTILGLSQANLSASNFVQTGSVGATANKGKVVIGLNSSVNGPGAFVKAKTITVSTPSLVPVRILAPVTTTLPAMKVNTSNTKALANLNVPNNQTSTYSGNYKDVTIGSNCNVTFSGAIFGKVNIGQSSQVTFTASTINVQSITLAAGTANTPGRLLFGSNASVLVNDGVTIGNNNQVNTSGNYLVVFYINGAGKVNDFHVLPGGNVTVTASVYSPKGSITIEGNATNNTYLNGTFIANTVTSLNSNIYWNSEGAVPLLAPAIASVKSAEIMPDVPEPSVKVYPNPFTEKLKFEFSHLTDAHATVEIFNIAGSRLVTLYDGNIKGGQVYNMEYQPKLISSQTLIYHLAIDGKVYVGKLIYQGRNR